MSEESKGGGGDLDIFEGLGKKSAEKTSSAAAPPPPPGSSAHLSQAPRKQGLPAEAKKTLLGIPGPAPQGSNPPSEGGFAKPRPRQGRTATVASWPPPPPPGRNSLPAIPDAEGEGPPLVAHAQRTVPSAAPASPVPEEAATRTKLEPDWDDDNAATQVFDKEKDKLPLSADDATLSDKATQVFDKEAADFSDKAATQVFDKNVHAAPSVHKDADGSSEGLAVPESIEPERASMEAILSTSALPTVDLAKAEIAAMPPSARPATAHQTATLGSAFGELGKPRERKNTSAPPSAKIRTVPPPPPGLGSSPPGAAPPTSPSGAAPPIVTKTAPPPPPDATGAATAVGGASGPPPGVGGISGAVTVVGAGMSGAATVVGASAAPPGVDGTAALPSAPPAATTTPSALAPSGVSVPSAPSSPPVIRNVGAGSTAPMPPSQPGPLPTPPPTAVVPPPPPPQTPPPPGMGTPEAPYVSPSYQPPRATAQSAYGRGSLPPGFEPSARLPQGSRNIETTYTPGRAPSRLPLIAALLLGVMSLAGVIVFYMMPRTGNLVINVTDAKGAAAPRLEIFVDGLKRCDAPCTLHDVPSGVHEIKVFATGYEQPIPKSVTVESRRDTTVDFALAASKLSGGSGFKVAGSQPGVKLTVDGKDIGPLPQEVRDLEPGEHKLHFSGERYVPLDKPVTVAKDEVADLGNISLKVAKGKVTIQLGTPDAKVYLSSGSNRKEVPQFPIAIEFDPNEKWELQGLKEGFEDFREKIAFDDGVAEKTITVTLTSKSGKASAAPSASASSTKTTPPKDRDVKDTKEAKDTKDTKETKETKEEAPAAPAAGETALKINSLPASSILLDGKAIGTTPQQRVPVQPGSHTVTFVNAEQSLKKTITVEVKQGETKAAFARLRE